MHERNDPPERLAPTLTPSETGPFPSGDPVQIGRYRVVRLLGEGGFGRVYLARDDDLDRAVAVKMPNTARGSVGLDLESYLQEGKTLAKLEHPSIVPVYDVGRTEDGHCFIVSKFVAGSDLSEKIRADRPGFLESAELIATVAEALHYAHTKGLVHRDVKPANILIDAQGQPCVADFGMALRDEDFGRGFGVTGTPVYMSPEQARGEGHRVDGRSDIFSLGVVFYELLTGRRPFKGDGLEDVLDQIKKVEARPPRQIDDAIPKELERICLKALSKKATDRYTTARDMADDLSSFFRTAEAAPAAPAFAPSPGPAQVAAREVTPAPLPPERSDSDGRPIKIVPKGLRSFDEHDADFFLELLPGPRDRYGLPGSIRFWKTQIESTDPDQTFRVGLIYGPSGCGKSSLVKAGLLPRLGKQVLTVHIEATAEETENRLLRELRKICPELPEGLGLADCLATARKGRTLRAGQKLLLVLDQFEQWLHAKRGEENTELAAALRQCDGKHSQAIVMVRDDFWMAATRLMSELEIELIQGHNTAAVDLFDPRHAQNVLARFGRAYGILPEVPGEMTKDQHAFLDQAIAGLAQDGQVVPVRLAMFAEMFKGKPWTPATLRDVGGTEGVGVTFLEETFSSPHANPRHRLHQKAARDVLKALLPDSGTDIKGQMRSEEDLRDATGSAGRPRDFHDVLHILDNELRLITPTDPEGSGGDRPATPGVGRYYQLTHDYLVPSLREWLTRKQKETRRGRAALRLVERASLWSARPENRHLPSIGEWARIRVLTDKRDWTETQCRMMNRAGRLHGLRAIGLAAVAAVLLSAGFTIWDRVVEANRATAAHGLVQQLLKADTALVPENIRALASYRRWADPELRKAVQDQADGSRAKLHASLALSAGDRTQAKYLYDRLLAASPAELPVIWGILRGHDQEAPPRLWKLLEGPAADPEKRFRAACALASTDPTGTDQRWEIVAQFIADHFLTAVLRNPGDYAPLLETLRPLRARLMSPLTLTLRDQARPESERSLATSTVAAYAAGQPGHLADALMSADPKQYGILFPVAEPMAVEVSPSLKAEIQKRATPQWSDPSLDSSWLTLDPTWKGRIESAHGFLDDRFAFCQTMLLDEYLSLAEALRKSGYRPARFRPYADSSTVRVAAAWTRDEGSWRMASGLTHDEIHRRDEKNRSEKFFPVDVAGYVVAGTDGKPSDRFAAIWIESRRPGEDARIQAGLTALDLQDAQNRLKPAGMVPVSIQGSRAADGSSRYCSVLKKADASDAPSRRIDLGESNLAVALAANAGATLIDLAVTAAASPLTTAERATASLKKAEAAIKATPDDMNARFTRAQANFQLGNHQASLDDLDVVVEKGPQTTMARWYRAMAHARLKHKTKALEDVDAYRKGDVSESSRLYLAVVVAALLAEGLEAASEKLESALKANLRDSGLHYDAACAFALASRAASTTKPAQREEHAARAVGLLQEAIRIGYSDYDHIEDDADFDPIRNLPAFAAIVKPAHADRRYAAVWSDDARFEAFPVHGLDPADQLAQCRKLFAQGYRLVSVSVASTVRDGPPATATVWHRPVVSEDVKDGLAMRQARAAVTLIRLGGPDAVWPLLCHSADPRLRSFIVNWLNPLGADPHAITAELDRLDSPATPGTRRVAPPTTQKTSVGRGSPDPAHPTTAGLPANKMDAVLFHPETSMRRALILALGNYGTQGLSKGDLEPLCGKLLDLYENDSDPGIHGAAEWTLRKWGRQEQLTDADARLVKLKDWGRRRWFLNGQGQAFVVIEGPVEFRMGSPPSEPDRIARNETPHRRVISRSFAIAAKEVTVEQYQSFAIENPDHQLSIDRYSPARSGPMNGTSWFDAAAYCNWLSRKEGLNECYLPNAQKKYAEGMTIRADALTRNGYRLPTESEWECSCRAGAETPRYYGASLKLLAGYAWYQDSSTDHAWPGGSLMPNDLGFFDMLGNVYEWCQFRPHIYQPDRNGAITDDISSRESITDLRLLRGGAFDDQPSLVRSSSRFWSQPANRNGDDGFRLARTYP